MTPFEIACPECDKKLKVTRPQLIGKKIGCPACKTPIRIKEPSSNGSSDAEAADDPGAVLAAAAASSTPSYSAGIRKSKQGGVKPKHVYMISSAVVGFVLLAFGANHLVNSRQQARLRENLTDAQRKELEEKEKIYGKGNVQLEVAAPVPKQDKPDEPFKSKQREDYQEFEFYKSLYGKIQQLVRSHNRNQIFQQLRAEVNQLERQYRYSKIDAPEFEEKCAELRAKINGIEREEVNKRLAVILELNAIEGPPAETLMAKYHDTVLPVTSEEWKINSAAREQVRLAVLSALRGTGLESKPELVARLVKFAEECY